MSVIDHDDWTNERLLKECAEPGDVVLIGAFGMWRVFPAGIRLLGREVDAIGPSDGGASYWTHSLMVFQEFTDVEGAKRLVAAESTKIPEGQRRPGYRDALGKPRWDGPQKVQLLRIPEEDRSPSFSPARVEKRNYLNETHTPNMCVIKTSERHDGAELLRELRSNLRPFLLQVGSEYPGPFEIAGTYRALIDDEPDQADAYPENLYCNEFVRKVFQGVDDVFRGHLEDVHPSRTLPEHLYRAAKEEGVTIHQVVTRPTVGDAPGERIAKRLNETFQEVWKEVRDELPGDLFEPTGWA